MKPTLALIERQDFVIHLLIYLRAIKNVTQSDKKKMNDCSTITKWMKKNRYGNDLLLLLHLLMHFPLITR